MVKGKFTPYRPRPVGSVEEALVALFDQAGGADQVADLLAKRLTMIAAYTDEKEENKHIRFCDVVRLTRYTGARAGAEYLAELLGGFVVIPDQTPSGRSWLKRGSDANKEFQEFFVKLIEFLDNDEKLNGDGVSVREAMALLNDAREARDELNTIVIRLQEIIQGGGEK